MHNVDLMLPDTMPAALADAAVDRLGARRGPSRMAQVHHPDGAAMRTFIVPLRLNSGQGVAFEVAGVELALNVGDDELAVVIRPRTAAGHFLSAVVAWVADRQDGAYAALTLPLRPGVSRYVDVPVVGRFGVRLPRG